MRTMSVRTQCPHCNSSRIESLDAILRSADADYFRCLACKRLWSVDKGVAGPPRPEPLATSTKH